MGVDFTAKLLNDVSKLPEFAQEDLPDSSCLTVFLLFCTEGQERELRHRAVTLYRNEKAIQLLDAKSVMEGDFRINENKLIDIINRWRDEANLSEVIDLNICPIITAGIGTKGVKLEVITSMLMQLDGIIKKIEMRPLWIPFMTNVVNLGLYSEGLKRMVECLTGDSRCCRVCIFSETTRTGSVISDTFIADVAILTVLLHTCDPDVITPRVLYTHGEPALYTSSAMFVSHHMVKPTLKSITAALGSMKSAILDGVSEHEFDFKFLSSIFPRLYEGMPRNKSDEISLAPLYGVMPRNGSSEDEFRERLWAFAQNHYLQLYEKNKISAFKLFHEKFFEKFRETNQPLSLLREFTEGKSSAKISAPEVRLAPLPKLPSKRSMDEDYEDAYKKSAHDLSDRLNGLGRRFIDEYFSSKAFTTVPSTYDFVLEQLSDIEAILVEKTNSLVTTETLQVILPGYARVFTNNELCEYVQNIVSDVIDGSDIRDSVSVLLDKLCEHCVVAVKKLRVEYLQTLSERCGSHDGIAAKSYLETAENELHFPMPNPPTRRECFLVWGNKSNNFLNMWVNKYRHVDYVNLVPQEHIAILSISFPFDDIEDVEVEA